MAGALLLLLALNAQDPVRVGARLTNEEIRAGETTVLRIDVETEGARAQVRPPSSLPPGIEVAGTRSYDQRQFSLPGGTRRFITQEYVLRARSPGRYRIPSVEVVVEGEVYATSSLLLTVASAPARERGEMPGNEDGVVLRAWLDADTVFVGQQVTLEVEAMFSQEARMRLRRAPEYEAPSPSGFWVHELPDGGGMTRRSVGADVYEVQRFRRAFFPLSPGDYTIPPARLAYEMRRGLLYAPESREVASDPLPLTVLPVPGDAPPAFTGAVGDYTVRARVEPAAVPVGEAAVLTVEVEGTGNVKALPAPELPALGDMEVFPPSEEAETEASGATIQGRKTFSWVLIPRRAGEVEIPGIRYAYFDPSAGGFETADVPPLTLRVTPAATGSPATPAPATVRFVKLAPDPEPWPWAASSWFAALLALPLFLLAGIAVWQRLQGRRGRASIAGLRRERRHTVRTLQERADRPDDETLFADAQAFARRWLARRLGVAPAATGDADALARTGLAPDTAAAVRAVLDRLAAARYAPVPPPVAERRSILTGLGRALEAVDGEAPRQLVDDRAATGAAARLLVLALAASAVVGAATPAAARQDALEPAPRPADTFTQGVAAFEDEAYERAAERFRRYVDRVPGDAAGWYNLGTTYYRMDRPGYGVWAWLRAARLDPRDDDTRHNLRVAGTPPELVQRVTPMIPLRRTELLLLGGALWLLAGAAGAAWLVRRSRPSAVVALAALSVALLSAGAWWDSTRGPETLIVLDAAVLRAGPALRADPVTTLQPGVGLVPVDRYGDWVRTRTLDGDEGWIESADTGRI